ncbi:hypothetical protein TNCV_2679721 [Trichonephila clavipes]|nr:hypothetical protein TNCV_2679721 [Trichonephila clavipes]
MGDIERKLPRADLGDERPLCNAPRAVPYRTERYSRKLKSRSSLRQNTRHAWCRSTIDSLAAMAHSTNKNESLPQ